MAAAADMWTGEATAKVPGVPADKVWAFIDDYANVYKYLPSIDETTIASGEPGKVGCVRLCKGSPLPGSEERTFTHEKLVAYDPENYTLSYEVMDNNIGFKDYVATLKVLPEEDGCCVKWSFVTPPMSGPNSSMEFLMGYLNYSVNHMAGKIAEAAKA
ncbi:hypothetical protein H6P81_009098 [Aristolochia fimbriata]|uniref:Lachrymatory factor synthase n=1 Tax=Aristolochia fimbriata TaxID=158543 RepID=A0AAV7EPF2_ARIFI|nr:hypothetical protein H6P81_009098 [Aristolochia fimbriata]